jgi:hypothetical protein
VLEATIGRTLADEATGVLQRSSDLATPGEIVRVVATRWAEGGRIDRGAGPPARRRRWGPGSRRTVCAVVEMWITPLFNVGIQAQRSGC